MFFLQEVKPAASFFLKNGRIYSLWADNISCSYKLIATGSCHKRQKPQAPTPQAPIRNRQTRKVANAKGLNRNTNLTQLNLT